MQKSLHNLVGKSCYHLIKKKRGGKKKPLAGTIRTVKLPRLPSVIDEVGQ